MTSSKSSQRGFTILETMVAIAILIIAVTGPLATIGTTLSQIYSARDQMIALNLAQEGIEAVRQKRDSNMLAHWTEGAVASTAWVGLTDGATYGATYDATGKPSLSSCSSDCRVYVSSAKQYFQGTPGLGDAATQFSRIISIAQVVPGDDAVKKVTSKVTWKTSTQANRDVTFTEYLYAENANSTP